MQKSGMTAAVAVIIALSVPIAYSQTTVTTPPTARTSATMHQMSPDEIRASKFIGSTVHDVQNQNLGSVKDLIFARDGKVDAAIVDVGTFLGMGGKYVAVKLGDFKMNNNRLTLDMTKDQLKTAQEFKFNDTNSVGMAAGTTGSGSSVPPPATRPAAPSTKE